MSTQNITLAIPKDILLKIKIIAAKQGTSISGLMTGVLEELVSREEGLEKARRRHLTTLNDSVNLGTNGTIFWTREDVHER